MCDEVQPESEWEADDGGGMKKWLTIVGLKGRIYTTSDPKKHKWGPGSPLVGVVTEAKKSKKGWPYAIAREVRLDKTEGAAGDGDTAPPAAPTKGGGGLFGDAEGAAGAAGATTGTRAESAPAAPKARLGDLRFRAKSAHGWASTKFGNERADAALKACEITGPIMSCDDAAALEAYIAAVAALDTRDVPF